MEVIGPVLVAGAYLAKSLALAVALIFVVVGGVQVIGDCRRRTHRHDIGRELVDIGRAVMGPEVHRGRR